MKLITKTTPVTHEDLFIERYEQLFLWALQMTGSDRELAEDLVQDAFIQFTFTRPDVHAIQHLDAYLYGLLRNLHVSQVRRSARNRLQPFSLVEYESAEMSLRAADIRDQIKAQDELRQICHYACVRKESSWAGSVLILRFFHGYYPSEIAKVLRTTRQSVDERLRIARSEAKLSLSNPESLSFMKDSATVLFGHTGFARKIDDFLVELRQMIFHSQHGLCFSSRQLQALYRSREAAPMKSEDLGHIVSCPTCLDAVNKLLGLPLLAGRYPTDTIGRDRRDKGDKGGGGDEGGSGGAAKSRVIDRWRRRAREAFEHRPKELHISVNGLLQGSQKINSELNEQTLDVDMSEQIGFVEVFSDLGIRLLILNVDEPPPRGQVEQSTRVDLSDHRTLDLKLRFDSPWPTLQVAYVDPLMRPEAATQLAEVTGTTLAVERPQTGAKGLLPKAGLRNVGSRLLSLVIRRRFWLRPGTVTALLALVLIAAVLFIELKRAPSPPLTAAILLRQSSAAEE